MEIMNRRNVRRVYALSLILAALQLFSVFDKFIPASYIIYIKIISAVGLVWIALKLIGGEFL